MTTQAVLLEHLFTGVKMMNKSIFRAIIKEHQTHEGTSAGFSKGRHYQSALIRAFVTSRTGKSYSNESNTEYYSIYCFKENNEGGFTLHAPFGYIQHSALVARKEKSPSARAGAADGKALAADDDDWEWLCFSSEKQNDESPAARKNRLDAAFKAALQEIDEKINTALEQQQQGQENPAKQRGNNKGGKK